MAPLAPLELLSLHLSAQRMVEVVVVGIAIRVQLPYLQDAQVVLVEVVVVRATH
jgi:hypothetical protein